jgi:plastocyanin
MTMPPTPPLDHGAPRGSGAAAGRDRQRHLIPVALAAARRRLVPPPSAGRRRQRLVPVAVAAAGVATAIGLSACSPTPANMSHGPLGASGLGPVGQEQAVRSAQAVIYIRNEQYVPSTLHVKAGSNILVVNNDRDSHSVTATNGSFNTGVIAGGGDDASFRVKKPGTYHFYDQMDPIMRGTIYVSP